VLFWLTKGCSSVVVTANHPLLRQEHPGQQLRRQQW
jgi:hypothetical protein